LNQEAADERKRLEEIKPTVEGVQASYEVEFGSPASMIVEFAQEHNVDLIVMGTHGRTGWRRIAMGSVAESVVRNVDCPVLAIKSETKVPQTS
jgi:nucleotide-binding universal stress UspA family protein